MVFFKNGGVWSWQKLGTFLQYRLCSSKIDATYQKNVNNKRSSFVIEYKVQTLWEGHKIWKNLPPVMTKQLFLLSSVKTSGRFFQIFVALSEKLDFKTTRRKSITFDILHLKKKSLFF